MSGLLSKDQATQKLLPLLTEMFSDDNKEVREGVTRAATKFIEAVGAESITNFLPHFKKTIEDSKWRVRIEAYDAFVELARHFHNPDLFQKTIEPLYMNYLKDRTAAVREHCAAKLSYLI